MFFGGVPATDLMIQTKLDAQTPAPVKDGTRATQALAIQPEPCRISIAVFLHSIGLHRIAYRNRCLAIDVTYVLN